MTEKIKEQILAVRETGETNMFNWKNVQVIADRLGLCDLVLYLEENKKKHDEYFNFIISG